MPKFNPTAYPVITKVVRGYLWFSSPDFDVHITERFEYLRQAQQIGELYLRIWARMTEVAAKRNPEKLPSPSSRADMFPKNPDDQEVGIGIAARIKGWSKDTLRREHKAGKIPAKTTPGGHLRFRVGDLQDEPSREQPLIST